MPVIKDEKRNILDGVLGDLLPSLPGKSDMAEADLPFATSKTANGGQKDMDPILPTEQWSADDFWNNTKQSGSAAKKEVTAATTAKLPGPILETPKAPEIVVPEVQLSSEEPEAVESQELTIPTDAPSSAIDQPGSRPITPAPPSPISTEVPLVTDTAEESVDPIAEARRQIGIIDDHHFQFKSTSTGESSMGTLKKNADSPHEPGWRPNVLKKRQAPQWSGPVEAAPDLTLVGSEDGEIENTEEFEPVRLALFDESGVWRKETKDSDIPHISMQDVVNKIASHKGDAGDPNEGIARQGLATSRIVFTNADTKPEIKKANGEVSDQEKALPPAVKAADRETNDDLGIPSEQEAMDGVGLPKPIGQTNEHEGEVVIDDVALASEMPEGPVYQAPTLTTPDKDALQSETKDSADSAHDSLMASLSSHDRQPSSPQPVQPIVPTPPVLPQEEGNVENGLPPEGTAQAVANEAAEHFAQAEKTDAARSAITISSVEPASSIEPKPVVIETTKSGIPETIREPIPVSLVDSKPEEESQPAQGLRLINEGEEEGNGTEVDQEGAPATVGDARLTNPADGRADNPTVEKPKKKGLLAFLGIRNDNGGLDKISNPNTRHAALLQQRHQQRQKELIDNKQEAA